MIWCGKKAYCAIFPSRVSGISKLQDKGSFGVVVLQSLLIALKNKGVCKITFGNFTQIPWQPSGGKTRLMLNGLHAPLFLTRFP